MAQRNTPTKDPEPEHFSLRLVDMDYIMAKPVEGLDVCSSEIRSNEPVSRVPVMRVFGSTPSGQRACLHLHQVSHISPRTPAHLPSPGVCYCSQLNPRRTSSCTRTCTSCCRVRG
jgi:hypothetical protein